ncbi:MAG: glycosyltransferase family 2 protein [Acidocella sp.]|nr:glycosyltransferase family 2 protein [Acidocella sp.]
MPKNNPHDPNVRHLVLIPSYNTGWILHQTVADALRHAWPVWVVIDGSTDKAAQNLLNTYQRDPRVRIIWRTANGGKGAAVFDGLKAANEAGFTHALVMDADGQHPFSLIPQFFETSCKWPAAMILGEPLFEKSAPRLRVVGRMVSNLLTKFETRGAVADSLFGFRVYPVAPLLSVMTTRHTMRGFDFDAEAVVRLNWQGVRAINFQVPVKYLRADEGGVSHFQYLRDNMLLARMHLRLMFELSVRALRVTAETLRHPAIDRDDLP